MRIVRVDAGDQVVAAARIEESDEEPMAAAEDAGGAPGPGEDSPGAS